MAQFPTDVFRAYDIRGTISDTFNAAIYYCIGQAIGEKILQERLSDVIVARDARLSSPALSTALIQGLATVGIQIIDIGTVTTPMAYFAGQYWQIRSVLMVTASHNPSDYNGLKIIINNQSITQQRIIELRTRVQALYATYKAVTSHTVTTQQRCILDAYQQHFVHNMALHRPIKLVLDCGNGIASATAPTILRQMGCTVIELFCQVDGRFPNHPPDPSVPENLAVLQKTVLAEQADIGIALDGDADRIALVTEKGTIIWPDVLLLLFARDLLQRKPHSHIIFDVKCTRNLARLIPEWGGRATMWKTGHSLIKNKLQQEQAQLAGEMSGHIFFTEDWYGFDDGLYAAARLLDILTRQTGTVSELFAQFPVMCNTPEIKLPMDEAAKASFMHAFLQHAQFPGGHVISLDGVRVEWPYGWGLIRASNTSPYLTLRFEAIDSAALQQIKQIFQKNVQQLGYRHALGDDWH